MYFDRFYECNCGCGGTVDVGGNAPIFKIKQAYSKIRVYIEGHEPAGGVPKNRIGKKADIKARA